MFSLKICGALDTHSFPTTWILRHLAVIFSSKICGALDANSFPTALTYFYEGREEPQDEKGLVVGDEGAGDPERAREDGEGDRDRLATELVRQNAEGNDACSDWLMSW